MLKLTTNFLLMALFLSLFSACEDDDDGTMIDTNDIPENLLGLDYVETAGSDFTTVYAALTTALDANPNIRIIAEVDHQANAQSVGAGLGRSTVVYFGNPNLGTPLMQANQRAGIDLPQKMLVYTAEDRDVITAFNNTAYLGRRHGVETVPTLSTIAMALNNFASNAGAQTVVNTNDNDVSRGEGLIEVTSSFSVDSTYENLIAFIEGAAPIGLLADVDHQANAQANNLELRPTRLVVFGNPTLGTPLMQEERSLGLDLPQKMLIFEEEDGTVKVVYNDIRYLIERHGFTVGLPEVESIENALANIARVITTE